ncbi:MAG: hypothetical protein QNJ37_08985 [Crocosphaera sp.]|nr:hypothetical protein [Crocosphaera sp.]
MYDNEKAMNYVANAGKDVNFWQNSDQLSPQELKRLQIITLNRIAVALESIERILDERINNP